MSILQAKHVFMVRTCESRPPIRLVYIVLILAVIGGLGCRPNASSVR